MEGTELRRVLNEEQPLVEKTTDETRKTKRAIIKDLAFLSMTCLFIFSSFDIFANLESSLDREGGIGVFSMSCLNIGNCLATLIAPVFFRILSAKGIVVGSCVVHVLFVASHFWPRAYVLLPAFFTLGVSFGPLMTALGVYITNLSMRYALAGDIETYRPTLSRFNGIFFACQQSTYVWGNILSSAILRENEQAVSSTNSSTTHTVCGSGFCQQTSITPAMAPPSQGSVNKLLAVLLGCDVMSLFISVFFLGTLHKVESKTNAEVDEEKEKSFWLTLLDTLKLMKNKYIIIMIPLFIFTGVEQTIMTGIFPLAFVTCELGISHVGYVMAVMGAMNMMTSLVAGVIGKWTGQLPLFLFGGLMNLVLLAVMFTWRSNSGSSVMYYVISGLLGLVDGVFQSQTGTLVGIFFPNESEAGFANWMFFKATAIAAVFASSYFLCLKWILLIDVVLMCLATILVIALHVTPGLSKTET